MSTRVRAYSFMHRRRRPLGLDLWARHVALGYCRCPSAGGAPSPAGPLPQGEGETAPACWPRARTGPPGNLDALPSPLAGRDSNPWTLLEIFYHCVFSTRTAALVRPAWAVWPFGVGRWPCWGGACHIRFTSITLRLPGASLIGGSSWVLGTFPDTAFFVAVVCRVWRPCFAWQSFITSESEELIEK